MSEATIQEVIEFADVKGLCKKDDRYQDFCKNNPYLLYRIAQVEFKEFQNLYYYLEGYTPFSTQHKIKGTEYSKVFVILDNGGWSNYDFSSLFGCGSQNENVIKRTHKLFYVCCTRAKNDLVVYYHDPTPEVINSAKIMFGECNVKNLLTCHSENGQ